MQKPSALLWLVLGTGACGATPARESDDARGPAPLSPDAATPATRTDGGPAPALVDAPVLTPGARLVGFPLEVDFGVVIVGSGVRTLGVVVTNAGDAITRPLTAALMPTAPDLRLTSNCVGRQLRPGETCFVTAEFEPTSVGVKMASGSVDDGAQGSMAINFTAKGTGRAAPDGGPDVASPPLPLDAARLPDAPAPKPDVAPPHDMAPPHDLAVKQDTTGLADARGQ